MKTLNRIIIRNPGSHDYYPKTFLHSWTPNSYSPINRPVTNFVHASCIPGFLIDVSKVFW